MSEDVFGYRRAPRVWSPDSVRNVKIVLRPTRLSSDAVETTHVGISGIQFHDAYISVTMPDGTAHLYPYMTLACIQALPSMDTSEVARRDAIERFRKLNPILNPTQQEEK